MSQRLCIVFSLDSGSLGSSFLLMDGFPLTVGLFPSGHVFSVVFRSLFLDESLSFWEFILLLFFS